MMNVLEGVSMLVLVLPVAMLLRSLGGGEDQFYLFPVGLILALPSGLLTLGIQYLRKRRDQKPRDVLLILGYLMTGLGVVGWLLIYVVVG